jgi:FlaG/FlaF family flagellin (archaellin)
MKGISTMVATIIMIVIVVTIASYIFSTVSGITKNSLTDSDDKTRKTVDCTGASVKVEDIFLMNGTPGMARVQVRNNGVKDPITITSAQLFNSTGYNFTAAEIPVNVTIGQSVIITFSNISVPACRDFSYVDLSTECPLASYRSNKKAIC